jgi:uncharacterized protein
MVQKESRTVSDELQPVKILCVADQVDPVVYSQNMKDRFRDTAFIIGAGDLKMRYYGFIVSMLNKPLYFVFGNHDLEYYKRFRHPREDENPETQESHMVKSYFGSTCIGDKVIRHKKTGLLLAGLGGSMRYNQGESQYTDFQMYMKVLRLIPKLAFNRLFRGRWIDILVTHAPPFGINDGDDRCHTGFKAFLWFMRVFKPRYLIHGHIHLWDMNAERVSRYQETTIINVYGRYILELETVSGPGRKKGMIAEPPVTRGQ